MAQPDDSAPRATGIRRFDRSAAERTDDALIGALQEDATTRVIPVDRDRVPVDADGRLLMVPVGSITDIDARPRGLLGRLDGRAVLVVSAGEDDVTGASTWAPLREVAATGDADTVEMLVTAVALARWYRDAAFCARCGGATELTTSGWARRCVACGREHFPRTDPAVIVAVTDGERLLLGSNAMWENNRFSCFAGFVEAGESLEDAVAREVAEEAGVVVERVEYVGSQAWPFPHSLMLGFRAVAARPEEAQPDGEEILAVRWFTRDEVRAAFAGTGDHILPGAVSIAHALIRDWVERAP